ncbi:MAG TPA: hypothetical protein DCE41_35175, partial [Cytophagales bacterium]|nr:hypothetical protein [Cytophagales bacterium]HAA20054.1 hypothetical protein [Cytophagales bacterium]
MSVVTPLVAVLLLLVLLCLIIIWRMWRTLCALRHPTKVQEATLHRVWEAQEAERERMARELHDGLGALLGAAHLVLSRVLVTLSDHPVCAQLAEVQ